MEERLIVAVSGCPALYDVSLFIYRDLVKKNEAWQKVSEMVGVPVEECKKRWKNLRDTFRREKTRKRERKRSGAVIGRPWRYMGMMGFLTPFMESRPGSGNMSGGVGEPMTQNSQGEEDQSQGQCEEVKEERREEQDSSDEGATPSTSEPALSAASVPRKRPRQKNISPFEERLLAALQTVTEQSSTSHRGPPIENPDEMFFRSLLADFKTLPERKRDELKFKIHQMIYEAKCQEADANK